MDTIALVSEFKDIFFISIFLLQKSGKKSVHISLEAGKKYVKESKNDFDLFSTLLKGYASALSTVEK